MAHPLLDPIPLHEAANFFVSIKRGSGHSNEQVKTASVKMKSAAQQVIADLLAGKMPEGKAGHFKTAAVNPIKHLKRYGELLTGSKARKLENASQMISESRAARKIDKLVNREREAVGVTRKITGGIAGAGAIGVGAGALKALAQKGLKEEPKHAHVKLANPPDFETASAASQDNTPSPSPVPQTATIGPSKKMPQFPAEYMNNEAAGNTAQEATESAFLRERLGLATQKSQAMESQISQIQSELDGLRNESAMAGTQAQTATQEAVEANDRALQHSQLAANMRIGIQKMRDQMLQIASQDPEGFAQSQMTQAGTPESSPEAGGGTPPGSAPAGAGGPGGAEPKPGSGESGSPVTDTAEGSSKLSTAMEALKNIAKKLPYAAAGAAAGAAGSVPWDRTIPKLESKVENLESQPGSFGQAVDLAQARTRLEMARIGKDYPRRAALGGAAGGAIAGYFGGPELVVQAKRVFTPTHH